ncbi:MAG: hypothetical protein QE271_04460 [Bacteriovoracaceae bacterium]|nr:hypothetical protein [Bacteriovoracaceae bacterium]
MKTQNIFNKINLAKRFGEILFFSTFWYGFLVPETIGQTTADSNSAVKISRQYLKDEKPFLALVTMFDYLKKNETQIEKLKPLIDKIITKTGTLPLYLYELSFLSKIKSPAVAIHVSQYYFKMKDYAKALEWTNYVTNESSYYPEALLVQASIYDSQKDARSLPTYDQCVSTADKYIRLMGNEKLRRYFVIIKEDCLINKGRHLYEEGKFKEALEQYDLIDKVSYSWPYVLMDKGWSHYKLRNYNRSLGVMMTYQSPLLGSYFFPEGEVLQALSYFQLCLYKDANGVIDKYYKVYGQKANSLKDILKKNANSDTYFFNLVYKDKSEIDQHPYLSNLRNQLKKQIKMNIHLLSYFKLTEEMDAVNKTGKGNKERDVQALKIVAGQMEKVMSTHVKEYITFFINSINYYSFEMFNIKLEMISRKKDLLYENKRFIASRARGSFKNVERDETEYFYQFKGEFWADEIGDYAFGLESNCKTIKAGDKI